MSEGKAHISAMYEVFSSLDQELHFEFILGSNEAVLAKINSKEVSSWPTKSFIERPGIDPIIEDYISRHPRLFGLHEVTDSNVRQALGQAKHYLESRYYAAFLGGVRKGSNTISVSYTLPLFAVEKGHNYFVNGRFLHYVQYDLSPLRNWTISEDSVLSFNVNASINKRSIWSAIRGRGTSVACYRSDDKPIQATLERNNENIKLTATLDKSFPNFIRVYYGDSDIVPEKYRQYYVEYYDDIIAGLIGELYGYQE